MFWKSKQERDSENELLQTSKWWLWTGIIRLITCTVIVLSLIYGWPLWVAITCGLVLFFTSRSWCLDLCRLSRSKS